MLTKQTKQSQIHPGASQPDPSPSLSPYLNPGWLRGVRVCSMDREGVNGPQASGSTYSYACNFLLSFFPLLLSKIPAKKASPSPGLQHREGKGDGQESGEKEPSCRSRSKNPQPRWRHTCESGQVPPAKQLGRSWYLQRQRPPSGVCRMLGPGSPPSPTIINLG